MKTLRYKYEDNSFNNKNKSRKKIVTSLRLVLVTLFKIIKGDYGLFCDVSLCK